MKKVLLALLIVLGIVLLVVGGYVAYLFLDYERIEDHQALEVCPGAEETLAVGEEKTIVSWNIGFGAYSADYSFFMDGGSESRAYSREAVEQNLGFVTDTLRAQNADFMLIQEVDTDSKRSYGIQELDRIAEGTQGFQNTFDLNYKTFYVPYPVPPIGRVSCGIATLSAFEVSDSQRVSLPCPFKYPVRLANLKRCLMVNRVPVEGSDKELVLVNLHLEAYDSGEGKIAQTKQLRELLESEAAKGNYVIAGGDFNQTFSNCDTSGYPLVSEDMWVPGVIDVSEFDNCLQFLMDNTSPSCRSLDKPLAGNDADPSKFQYYMIDGFIVSDNLKIDSLETKDLKFKNTDHNPVIMQVTLKEE